jgi:hypothetical protein
MKQLISIIGLIMCFGLLMNYTTQNIIDLSQPPPLILDNNSDFILQPIVDNIDLPGYSSVFTLKIYYKDKLNTPITFRNGDPLETYCSDSTIVTFYLSNRDSIVIGGLKRMSCKILVIINLTKQQNRMLRDYPLDSIQIHNFVTENKFLFPISDKQYLNRWIGKYNHWR